MSPFAKIVAWVVVGIALLLVHWFMPRSVADLRAGLAVLFVCWCGLSFLWFCRTLFRFVVR
jgi:hypothetical protein